MSSEANIQTVIETVDSAISARFQLSQLLDGVNDAKHQVNSTHAPDAFSGSSKMRMRLVRLCPVRLMNV